MHDSPYDICITSKRMFFDKKKETCLTFSTFFHACGSFFMTCSHGSRVQDEAPVSCTIIPLVQSHLAANPPVSSRSHCMMIRMILFGSVRGNSQIIHLLHLLHALARCIVWKHVVVFQMMESMPFLIDIISLRTV